MMLLLPPPPRRRGQPDGRGQFVCCVAREGRLIGQRQHGEAGKEESEAEHTSFLDGINQDEVKYSKKVPQYIFET